VNNQKTVSFYTLGCRLNFSETGAIAKSFEDQGYKIVPFEQSSDYVFLNTCTVTDGADATARSLVRKARKNSPNAKVLVSGCYAQMEAQKLEQMPEVDLILGNSQKYDVINYLKEENKKTFIDQTNDFWGAYTTPSDYSHTRGFLKIQDGCNYICSFCIIPFARGRSRTISVKDARNNAQNLIDKGYKEIILTGVNIGEYEAKSGEKLSTLVNEILSVEGIQRLRFSSVEPNTITKELLETLKSSGVYQNHFHIPLQSGCDKVLKSMRRKYSKSQYRDVLAMVKDYFPKAAIGADIIAGYPGETKEEFQETYDFVSELPITHFHVFPFSRRKGTTADKLPDHIAPQEKKERVKNLIKLGERKLYEFAKSLKEQEHSILFEQKKGKYWVGRTSEFIKFKYESEQDLKNEILTLKAAHMLGDGTYVL